MGDLICQVPEGRPLAVRWHIPASAPRRCIICGPGSLRFFGQFFSRWQAPVSRQLPEEFTCNFRALMLFLFVKRAGPPQPHMQLLLQGIWTRSSWELAIPGVSEHGMATQS